MKIPGCGRSRRRVVQSGGAVASGRRRLPAGLRARLRTSLALAVLAAVTRGASAQVPVTSQDLRLPSSGAGGGTLAVRLLYPQSPSDFRYPCGAPVTVYLPGAFGAGNLGAGRAIAEQGFVAISFLYPGGAAGGSSSDGVYDYRGDNCQQALRDVLRFACGAATDSLGRTIADLLPGPVHTEMVGLTPFSNGLIGLVTLARHGAAIPCRPWQAGWENPTSGQIVNVELGGIANDCDAATDSDGNGIAGDDGRNPWHDPATGYGPASFAVDFSRLAFDPNFPGRYTDPVARCAPVDQDGAVFHDGLANGRLDVLPPLPGCLDLDSDGVIEQTEDYSMRNVITFTAACELKVHYSLEVAQALESRGVFGAAWPSWIATPAETDVFWELRDATRHWDDLSAAFPGFAAITVFSARDHVQSQPDHPHIRQAMDGIQGRGHWYRLQADAAYFEAVTGALPPGYVETPAGTPIAAGEMKLHAEPEGTQADPMGAAAASELADRIHSGCWWPDLDAVLGPVAPPGTAEPILRMDPDKTGIAWTPAPWAFCHDVLRGDLAVLSDDGARVLLAGAACVEEDSPDSASSDPARPGAGRAFYYLVRPNGLHGGWGASSSGHPREDPAGACRN